MNNDNYIEKILWSIAFPGFGQILNKKLIKGILFIVLELIINIKANINEVIILSFQGDTIAAVRHANYQWLMFYPCIYIFAIWDAYKDSKKYGAPYEFLPFVLSAYLGTIGVIYSSVLNINRVILGPVWLPIICLILGAFLGTFTRHSLIKYYSNRKV